MAIIEQKITDRYAAYNGDCLEVIPNLKKASAHCVIYSPPFAELYNYSSSDRDLSNCKSYEEFLQHYEFVVKSIADVLMPGRIACVHCMDLRKPGGDSGLRDFPGDIIRLHQRNGFSYRARHIIWKEPLRMAIKTRALGLRHAQIVKDSSKCHAAGADYLLVFRRNGENRIPIAHKEGLSYYAGSNPVPSDLVAKFGHGWKDQKTNKLSHIIWQRYASSVWSDIRIKRVIEYREGRESDEEKHICPLQLDVIERCLTLYSNPGETILTPFMGVGSEVCGAIQYGRRGVGIELKPSYYRQALKNIQNTITAPKDHADLFAGIEFNDCDDDETEMEDSE